MTASSAAFGGVFFLLITAGAALSYSIAGAGEPLVLLHRFRGTLDDWDPALVNELARVYRVVTFDSVGIGGMTNLSSGCRTG